MGKVGRSSCSTFLTSAGKDEVKLTRVWTWLSILLPDGKINYQRETLKECPRTLRMYEIAECQTPEFLFSFQLHVALRKCSRSHNGTSVHTHTSHFPVLVGANTKPRGNLSFPFLSFALSKWPRGLPGSAASGPGGGGRGDPPAPRERRGTFPRRAGQTMPAPAPRAGRAPHRRGPAAGRAVPASLQRARGATRGPHSPRLGVSSGDQTPWALRSPGRRPPRAGRDAPLSVDPGARPARNPGASARLAGAGGRRRPGAPPTEPVRAPRNSPGPGGPLGIIPSPARRQRPGGGGDRGSRGGARGAAGSGGRGARAGLPERRVPARGGQARRGRRARRRKGRATMCRGEEAAAPRAARTIPLGGGGRGLRKSKHFGRKSES